MTAGPRVTVVVPTRDRPAALARCLAALERQTVDGFEVVIVDDRSRDREAVRAVVARVPHARVLDGEGRGPAAARNLGASAAAGDVICFTDDDCAPDAGWLAALEKRFGAGSEVVAGPTLAQEGTDAFVRASQLVTNHLVDSSRQSDGSVAFAPTSNIACRREVQRAVPFDESFPTAAGEDRAWCDRLREVGHDIDLDPAARVRHSPALTARTFWRQQTRYGAGAYRYFGARGEHSRPQPLGFYVALVRRGFAEGVVVGVLVVVAQLATAVGLGAEAYRARR